MRFRGVSAEGGPGTGAPGTLGRVYAAWEGPGAEEVPGEKETVPLSPRAGLLVTYRGGSNYFFRFL